jgi:cytoskeletal protein RodZ
MLRTGLAAVGIGLLIVLSGCANDRPVVGPTSSASSTATSSQSSPVATPSAQPTKQAPVKPTKTSVTVVMNGDLLWHNTSSGFLD